MTTNAAATAFASVGASQTAKGWKWDWEVMVQEWGARASRREAFKPGDAAGLFDRGLVQNGGALEALKGRTSMHFDQG